MKEFHIDEPREIGRKKQRLSRGDISDIKDELIEVVIKKKIREVIKRVIKKYAWHEVKTRDTTHKKTDFDYAFHPTTLIQNVYQ